MILGKRKCQHVLLLIGFISPIVASANQLTNHSLNPNWNGFYMGVNAGGMWSENTKINISSSFVPGSQNSLIPLGAAYTGAQSALGASGSASSNISGLIGGVQIGYNWQLSNRFVTGIETDFQGVSSKNNKGYSSTVAPLVGTFDNGALTYLPGSQFATALAVSKHIDYLGTIRGRFGLLATPALLLSVTGGLVYGGVSSSASISQTNNDAALSNNPAGSLIPQTFSSGNYADTRFGWTIGVGAEWMFMPNWSTKLEYLYYDMGSVSYILSQTVLTIPILASPIAVVNSRGSTLFNGNVIRAGVSYHFS